MSEVQREQYIAVVERLAGRWLPSAKRTLPAGMRARLIGERALDAFEDAADDSALVDAVAALSAADALGSTAPELRERLGHLTESPVRIARYDMTVASSAPGEPESDRLGELLALVDARTGESRTAAPTPLPAALGAANGYTGEVSAYGLLVEILAMRDTLNPAEVWSDSRGAVWGESVRLGRIHLMRFVGTGSIDALDQAIEVLQEAVAASAEDEPVWQWHIGLGDLVLAQLMRYDAAGHAEDLNEALHRARAAQEAAFSESAGPRYLALWQSILGAALWMRHESDGDSADLKASADALWVAAHGWARVTSVSWLRLIGVIQRQQYALSRQATYLERALAQHRRTAMAEMLVHDATVPREAYASVGYTHLAEYERSREPDELDRAAQSLTRALETHETQERNSAAWLDWTRMLVSAQRLRVERSADRGALEGLVISLVCALAEVPADAPERAVWLGMLGEALLWRYELVGESDDLRTARSLLERADDRSALATVCHVLYLHGSDLRALDDAVRIGAEEVRRTAGPEGAHVTAAAGLGLSLLSRAEVLRAPMDALAAVRLLDHCLEWGDQSAEQRAFLRAESGCALLNLHELRADGIEAAPGYAGDPLDDAAMAVMDALDVLRSHERDTARIYDLLTRVHVAASLATAREQRLGEGPGLQRWERPLWRRVRRERALDEWAVESGVSRFLRRSGDLSAALRDDPVTMRGLLRERIVDTLIRYLGDRPAEQVRQVVGQAGLLARACLEAGDAGAALELVESGRALAEEVASGAATATGSVLEQHRRMQRARRLEIAGPASSRLPRLTTGAVSPPLPGALRTSLLDALSATEGLLTHSWPTHLCQTLGVDAVVHLLAGRDHGWALVLHSSGQLHSLRLPQLRSDAPDLGNFTGAHDQQLRRATNTAPSDPWRGALRKVCDWAWRAAMKQLSEYFSARGPQGTPRIVLVPSGTLGLVPWHAARHRVRRDDGSWTHRFAIESMAISYAPSVRMLTRFAERSLAPLAGSGLVVVDPTGDLPHARQEGEDLYRWFYAKGHRLGGSGETTVPATTAAVITALRGQAADRDYPVAHFACHARSSTPATDSYLMLAGGQRLRADRLLGMAGGNSVARDRHPLVVLSACATAVPGAHYDGALSLSTAFAAAGAAAVVGSLWHVEDAATAALMRDFHTLLNLDGMPPAEALRTAQLRLLREARARTRGQSTKARTAAEDPFFWAAFVHQGRGHLAAPPADGASSAIAELPDDLTHSGGSSDGFGLRLPIFSSLPGPGSAEVVWTCPLTDCAEEAIGDDDSPYAADCCPTHPDSAFVKSA
ncbi:CHAT domain-containing protein [Streptomyces sp. NPDC127097]|uniref:CHAT domain-containing protein n=1 Tax=Streptomyces sp. NPDC127097 TaxID=3347136 RepID=UPI00366003D3